MGGKRRLCPIIFREINRILPRQRWADLTFLDGFLGGGSVSLYAKAQGFKVIATDIAERSIIVGQALIENNHVRLTYEDILRAATPDGESPGRIEQAYVPAVFTLSEARLLDRIIKMAIKAGDKAKKALLLLLAIRVALSAHPMSSVRSGTIHRVTTGEFEAITPSCVKQYINGLRLGRPERSRPFAISHGVSSSCTLATWSKKRGSMTCSTTRCIRIHTLCWQLHPIPMGTMLTLLKMCRLENPPT